MDNVVQLHEKLPDIFQEEMDNIQEGDVAMLIVKTKEGVYKLVLQGEWDRESYAYISTQINRLVP